MRRDIQAEILRKQKEWDLTKKTLENKMKEDLDKMRKLKQKDDIIVSSGSSTTSPPPLPPPQRRKDGVTE